MANRCACTSFRHGLHTMFLPCKAHRQSCGALDGAVRVPVRAHMSVASYGPMYTGAARVLLDPHRPRANEHTGVPKLVRCTHRSVLCTMRASVHTMHPRAPYGTRRVCVRGSLRSVPKTSQRTESTPVDRQYACDHNTRTGFTLYGAPYGPQVRTYFQALGPGTTRSSHM